MTDGTVEVLFPDGTVAQTFVNGDKILILPNGQKEIHTKAHKVNECFNFLFCILNTLFPFAYFTFFYRNRIV